jgi:hypothetical protein
MCHCRNDGAGLTDIPDDDAAGWAGIDPRITAALTDPAVCGWLETSGGRPCNNCLSGIRIKLGKGFTVEQILDDIAHYRADNIARASL